MVSDIRLGTGKSKTFFTVYAVSKPPDIGDVLTMEELLQTLAGTVSCGGNILINIGPTSQGTIPTIFQVFSTREPYQPSSRYEKKGRCLRLLFHRDLLELRI